jgi:hypothetical protein
MTTTVDQSSEYELPGRPPRTALIDLNLKKTAYERFGVQSLEG